MSTADGGWDLTVPEDASELASELRRHGVVPGQHLHIRFDVIDGEQPDAAAPATNADEAKQARKLNFIGSIDSGPSDLSTRTDDYLGRGFGR
jgi:hypothetical protein